jgi:hypothetical protein
MHSQLGSPSRKNRRTREERRKTTDGMGAKYSIQDENMINVSPMKKTAPASPKQSTLRINNQVLSEVDINTLN